MSLVGPRPERPELAARIEGRAPGFAGRLRVRPGIAGLAQWMGAYDTDPRRKLRHDRRPGPDGPVPPGPASAGFFQRFFRRFFSTVFFNRSLQPFPSAVPFDPSVRPLPRRPGPAGRRALRTALGFV